MHRTKAPIRNRFDGQVYSLRGYWLLLLMAFCIHEAGCGRASQSAVQNSLRGIAGTKALPRFVLRGEAETAPWKETQAFYRQRNFQPAWIQSHWSGGTSVRSHAAALVKCIRECGQEGLDPDEYSTDELEQQIRRVQYSTTPNELAWLDAELTYTFYEYAAHLYRGRLNPKRISPTWQVASRNREWAPFLEEALAQTNICEALAKLAPALPNYRVLRKALGVYRGIAEE